MVDRQLMLEAKKAQAEQLLQKEQAEEERRERALRPIVGVEYTKNTVDPFQILPGVDPFAQTRGWDRTKSPTTAQIKSLKRYGVTADVLGNISRGEASVMIGALFERRKQGLCTLKQAKILRRHKFNPDEYTFESAPKQIDAIANSGWTLYGDFEG